MDTCPSRDELQRAIAGSLDSNRQQFLERHLESCDFCRQKLDAVVQSGHVIPKDSTVRSERVASEALQRAIDALSDAELAGGHTAQINLSAEWRGQRPPFLGPSDLPDFLGKLGPYEIRRLIGRGGMGMVFEGLDPVLKRSVAIKVLSPLAALSDEDRSRFLREAQAAAALSHEHIVAIHGVDQVQNMPFLVLQYIEGESLADRLRRRGRLPFAEVVRLGAEVARGLAAAHAKGLIHRDIKPGNILLEQETGRAKITDFGLAKNLGDKTLTVEGTIAGTPEFMSPEQASSGPVDARTDLFSLGVVLYAAASGVSPFSASSPLLTLERVRQHTPPPLKEVDPPLPTWFCETVDRLLAKDPRDRIASANALAELLERAAAPPPLAKPSRSAPRKRLAVVLAGLALTVVVAVILILNRPKSSRPEPSPTPEKGFVVAGQTTVYRGLGDAIAAAHDHDVIDVYGDGPYPTPPLQAERKHLTIRAAANAQPAFQMETPNRPGTQPFFTTDSDLRLEGLSIYWSIDLPMGKTEAEMLSRCVIVSTRGRVELVNCRIVTGRMNGCVGVTGRDLELTNCHCASDNGLGVFWRPAPGKRLTIDNCIFDGRVGLSIMTTGETSNPSPATVTLTRNTFAVEKSIQFARFPGPKQPLDISARGNIFDNSHHVTLLGQIAGKPDAPNRNEMIDFLRSIAKWSDEENVHRRGAQYLVAQRPGAHISAEIDSLARWLRLWNLPPEQSAEGGIHFHKRENKSGVEPLRLDRLENLSGPKPDKVGADPERVGPGPAYHGR